MPTSRILALESRDDHLRVRRDPAGPRSVSRLATSRRTPLTIGALVLATGIGLATAPAAESTGVGTAAISAR